jgi:hypothetical protein
VGVEFNQFAVFLLYTPHPFCAALSKLRLKSGVHFPVHPFGSAKLCFAYCCLTLSPFRGKGIVYLPKNSSR